MKVDLRDANNNVVGEVQLDGSWLCVEDKDERLCHQVVLSQLAARRRGTAGVKNRAAVSGGGVKPFRQKGTGRARQGTSRSPLHVGGGVIFGPVTRDYSFKVNKKLRRKALAGAFCNRARHGHVVVLKDFGVSEMRTRHASDLFKRMGIRSALVVDVSNDVLHRSVRNLPCHKYLDVKGLNVYDLLKYEYLVISDAALDSLKRG